MESELTIVRFGESWGWGRPPQAPAEGKGKQG